ncbi:hypothetical protein BN000_01630 [Neobacillus massiliamazoniensis]|uniref:Uncharacterized protein n=1 Tax=Neobacillus massiliamazoniensis TaxID=1499688 RepID=A0A0U1NUI6_9BACI|nr:hypothetical protein BN000_01630 [Neobacillus massiliamazoniensis]
MNTSLNNDWNFEVMEKLSNKLHQILKEAY